MLAFLNGRFLPEEEAVVPVTDRCFLYGDGLFETLRIRHGVPFRWRQHMDRLARGADFLSLRVPYSPEQLLAFAVELARRNQFTDAILRLTLSRGAGPRGYSPAGVHIPTLVMTTSLAPALNPAQPARWRLVTASFRVPAGETMLTFKTCNKLPQVLARVEAEAKGADEALLLNTRNEVAEAAAANVFWIERGAVCTPPLEAGVLAGVTRALLLELCHDLDIPGREGSATLQTLAQAEGVFLTLSTLGLVEAISLDGRPVRQAPQVAPLWRAYVQTLDRETAPGKTPNGSAAGC